MPEEFLRALLLPSTWCSMLEVRSPVVLSLPLTLLPLLPLCLREAAAGLTAHVLHFLLPVAS